MKKHTQDLKEFNDFSSNLHEFKELFNDSLKDDKKAIDILLELSYSFLNSQGERYNMICRDATDEVREIRRTWLDLQLSKINKDLVK